MSVLSAKKWSAKYAAEWIRDQLHAHGGRCPGPCKRRFVHDPNHATLLARFRTVGRGEPMTIDHIIPRAKGGTNANSNLTIMCRRCNMRKTDKLPAAAWAGYGWS